MKKMIAIAAAAFVALPVAAFAAGLTGQCVDCHTMHNSEQGAAVAVTGLGDAVTQTPIPNLLRMDCIACHVVDPNGSDKIVDMGNGSAIPQVWHADSTGDLAGGNFKAINDGGSRKGHNVADLFAGGDNNGGTYGAPPGKFRDSTHGPSFTGAAPFSKFTCAGQGGCHGTRSQLLGGSTNDNGTSADSSDDYFVGVARVGIPAVSGAHHANFDGAKNADENYNGANGTGAHSGAKVADGYRMIPGLQGYGNVAARWQNVDETSHNEYFGAPLSLSTSCGTCHNEGLNAGTDGGSNRLTTDSTIKVPNQSMSGFCATCHGVFHSVGTGAASLSDGVGKGNNGVSGAFQRHPSDFVIPNEREYANYQLYTVTAPVARPTLYTAADSVVYPGTDMVMCLSCHKAHASDHDYMLRFDYAGMVAGTNPAADGTGCLACHTTKGKAKVD